MLSNDILVVATLLLVFEAQMNIFVIVKVKNLCAH